MRITNKQNYICVSELKSFSEFAEKYDQISDNFAVLFTIEEEIQYTSQEKEFLLNLPFITVIAGNNLSCMSLDFLMLFDVRLSDNEYIIDNDKIIDNERFCILFGKKANIIRKTENSDYDSYFSKLFKDKSVSNIKSLVKCLVTARSGDLQKVFYEESVNFYTMIKEKVEDNSDGN